MLKEIVNSNRSKVWYDEKNEVYIKKFYPKFSKKIKYLFKISKYPGENFNYISQELKKIGIKTSDIVYYSKYEVHTKKVVGKSLEEIFKGDDLNTVAYYLEKYIQLINKLIENKIFFCDFSGDNFFVQHDDIVVIDLEDYRKSIFFKKKKMLKKIKDKLDFEVRTSNLNKIINSEKLLKK